MPFEFTLSDTVPASPRAVYDAWLSSGGHAAMTGGKAAHAAAAEGAEFTAWDGYISGRNLRLEPGRRIVQSWRTTRFTAADADSEIDVLLEPVPGGTRLTLHHSNVPDGHTSYRDGGWQRSYFEPMKRFFAGESVSGPGSKPDLLRTRRSSSSSSSGSALAAATHSAMSGSAMMRRQ